MKKKVEFLYDVEVKDGTGTRYTKGQIVEFTDPSCRHWVSRNKARYYCEPVRAKKEEKPAESTEKKEAEKKDK